MPLIYRAMQADGDKPLVGTTTNTLGIRLPPAKNSDIPLESDGCVEPGKGGLSVAPAWRELPFFLIPRRLKPLYRNAAGKNSLSCWKMGEGAFTDGPIDNGLKLRVEHAKHGLVEPATRMQAADYQAAIAATQSAWEIDER